MAALVNPRVLASYPAEKLGYSCVRRLYLGPVQDLQEVHQRRAAGYVDARHEVVVFDTDCEEEET